MEPLRCDIIGCYAPAAWARVREIDSVQEDFLCHRCWGRLRRLKPTQASCYVACGDEMTAITSSTLLMQGCDEEADAEYLIG